MEHLQEELDVRTDNEKEAAERDFQDVECEEEITFPLTEANKAEALDEIVVLTKSRKELEVEAKKTAKQFKSDVENVQAAIDAHLLSVDEGSTRQIHCVKRNHFGLGKISEAVIG